MCIRFVNRWHAPLLRQQQLQTYPCPAPTCALHVSGSSGQVARVVSTTDEKRWWAVCARLHLARCSATVYVHDLYFAYPVCRVCVCVKYTYIHFSGKLSRRDDDGQKIDAAAGRLKSVRRNPSYCSRLWIWFLSSARLHNKRYLYNIIVLYKYFK